MLDGGFDLDEWANLGNLLLRQGSLTRLQLERALDEQRKRKTALLGELLIELKICSQADIDDALHAQKMHRLPEPSEAAVQAQSILQKAYSRVERETDRLSRRASTIEMKAVEG